MTIIPFNAKGVWFEAVQIGPDWRVMVHDNGTDTLLDSAVYSKEQAEHIAMANNRQIHMEGIEKI